MLKKDIRKEYIVRRESITPTQWDEMNQAMLDHFASLSLQGIQYLMSYYPIPERKEFDTIACEKLLKLDNTNLTICWPRLADDHNMEAVIKDAETRLRPNRYNIHEPINAETIDPQLIDAIFVPLLAFDLQGYRVGYGKGYYDRFLFRCAQDVVKIGFSFFDPLERIDDINPFDVPLSFCITPKRIYEF